MKEGGRRELEKQQHESTRLGVAGFADGGRDLELRNVGYF